jgi:TolB-like protein
VLIEGQAADDDRVASLKINGEEILRRPGARIFFSHLVGLAVGNNVVSVAAEDGRGNGTQKTIAVMRRQQAVRRLGARLRVAVLPMETKGTSSPTGEAVYDAFVSALVRQGRFDLVERVTVEDVLRELKLSASELVDPTTAVKAGRLASAEALLTGTVVETERAVEVIARLVDTETSLILAANDVYDEDKSLRTVQDLTERLAFKFKRDFPLMEGMVINVKGDGLMIDLGSDHRLRRHTRLIMFREGDVIRHPLTGRILGADTEEIGEARVTNVFKEFAEAAITRRTGDVRTLDRVITK